MKGEYEVINEDLIPYHTAAIALAESFEGFYIDYVPRLKNTYANVLASLAATLALPEGATQQITVTSKHLFKSKYVFQINVIEDEPIKNLASTTYNPAANGQAEAFNKTIIRILTKVVSTNKRDWNEKLGQSL
ncbi:uncharacterized protein LOC109835489 [Asparagus officinalis]|uniref:uncharacterized protein LOC109835489 n=1 Tax=Asparagus officinalis TaxID=4686 RepID=UPI00098DF7DA|nr:uncharacterized protein LOC109835489 [Asparagus officinalis]